MVENSRSEQSETMAAKVGSMSKKSRFIYRIGWTHGSNGWVDVEEVAFYESNKVDTWQQRKDRWRRFMDRTGCTSNRVDTWQQRMNGCQRNRSLSRITHVDAA